MLHFGADGGEMIQAAAIIVSVTTTSVECGFGYGCASLNLSVGMVRGNSWQNGEEFLALPYGSAARFEAPIVSSSLPGPAAHFDATNILGHGEAACAQPNTGYVDCVACTNSSYGVEDCLILNLYLPHTHRSAGSRAPIMIWIFGGDNTLSEIIPYNATQLAGKHDAIVAVVSYRLGMLGFAAFLDDPKQKPCSGAACSKGNNGMLDVLAAAEWLKREAVNLGGDPDSITVFGESSGATDAQILGSMSPLARGLINGSISESGGLYAHDLNDTTSTTTAIAHKMGCDGVLLGLKECMQQKGLDAIIDAAQNDEWGPTVDGVFLTDQPRTLLEQGALNPGVSVLWGDNTNASISDGALVLKIPVFPPKYLRTLNATIYGVEPHYPGDSADDATAAAASSTASTASSVEGEHVLLSKMMMSPPPPQRALRKKKHSSHARRRRRAALGLIGSGKTKTRQDQGRVPRSSSSAADPFPAFYARALALYPPRHHFIGPFDLGDNADIQTWYESDMQLCSQRRDAAAALKALAPSGGSAYSYRYDWFFQSDSRCIGDSNWHDPSFGSIHCDEMTFVFGQPIFDNQDAPGFSYTNCSDPLSAYYDAKHCTGCHFNETEASFSDAIGTFWSTFARTGSPAPPSDEKRWPPAVVEGGVHRNVLLHPDAIAVETDMGRAAACALWDDVAEALAKGRH